MTPIAPLITAFLREHMPIERVTVQHLRNVCSCVRLLFEFASVV